MNDETPVSVCCGAEMADYPDRDICPSCGEHTGVETIKEDEVMEDIYTEETEVMKHAKETREINECFPNASEAMEWVKRLWLYASGRIKWDTSKDWVCEEHPHLPAMHLVKSGVELVDCGAPGMPPLTCRESQGAQIKIGEFTLQTPHGIPCPDDHLFLDSSKGSGFSFPVKKLEECLSKFYDENK